MILHKSLRISNKPWRESHSSSKSMRSPSRQSRWFLVSYVPRREHGEVTGFCAASVDITEKKELEKNLRERFEQYRALGDSIPFGVWIADPEDRVTYVSQSFLDLASGPGTWKKEHRIIGADGQMYHILALGRPIRDATGQVTSWAGLNLDITVERRRKSALRS
jgi:PAS domain-containing protein